jgi:hypothetical protein
LQQQTADDTWFVQFHLLKRDKITFVSRMIASLVFTFVKKNLLFDSEQTIEIVFCNYISIE